jgi:hypothetical protein
MSGRRAVEGGLLTRDIECPGMAPELAPCDQAIFDHRVDYTVHDVGSCWAPSMPRLTIRSVSRVKPTMSERRAAVGALARHAEASCSRIKSSPGEALPITEQALRLFRRLECRA